jgi:hypothetical protein
MECGNAISGATAMCTNTQNDPNNVCSCRIVCAQDEACNAGVCAATCGGPTAGEASDSSVGFQRRRHGRGGADLSMGGHPPTDASVGG